METLSSHSSPSVSLISNICILRSSAHCMGKDLISVYEVRWGEVRWGEVVITNVENMMDLWVWSFWWWTEVQYNQVMISPSPHCYHHLSKYFSFISQTIMTTSTSHHLHHHLPKKNVHNGFLKVAFNSTARQSFLWISPCVDVICQKNDE